MSYSVSPNMADCYEGTACLVNKFKIKDDKQLSKVEASITFAKASELEENPLSGCFDVSHYKAIHKFLFSELYEWAGEFRTTNISKKGTKFADFEKIDELCKKSFGHLKENNYFLHLPFDDYVSNIVDLYNALNYIHPFREGNGRVQRAFLSQLIRYNGYDINFSQIDADMLMIATIQASHGVKDNLLEIFRNSIIH